MREPQPGPRKPKAVLCLYQDAEEAQGDVEIIDGVSRVMTKEAVNTGTKSVTTTYDQNVTLHPI